MIEKIETLLGVIAPEYIAQVAKASWEQHKEWFKDELPNMVIDKLFVIGRSQDNKKHAYVVKKKVHSMEDTKIDFAYSLNEIKNDFQIPLRLRNKGMNFHKGADYFIIEVRLFLRTVELRAKLADQLKCFCRATRKIISKGKVLDMGIVNMGSNIRITPEGELRMIDTDKTFDTTEIIGGKKENLKHEKI